MWDAMGINGCGRVKGAELGRGESGSVIQSKQRPPPSQGDSAAKGGTEELSSIGAKDPAIIALC